MRKRILSIFLVTAALFVLAACKTKTFKVTFDSDGGSDVAAVDVEKGKTVTKPTDPTKDGFDFVEWQLDGEAYDFSDKVTKDITLKAKWEAIVTYKVTFDSDEGSVVESQTVNEGGKATKPEDPKRTGYKFEGWFVGEDKYDFDTAVTGDITVKAKWVLIEYNVTYDTDGGSTAPAAEKVKHGAKLIKPEDPTKAGVKFVEWRLEGKDREDKTIYTSYDFAKEVTADLKLKAFYGYEVTFDQDGGSLVPSKLVVKDEKVAKPVDPTKRGFVFVEWRLDGEAFDFNVEKITKDITLEAIWGFEVKFDQGFDGAVAIVRVGEGETVEKLVVSRPGYEFEGWFLGDEEFLFDTPIDEHITLLAKWTEDVNYTALANLDLPLKVSKDLTLPTTGGVTWVSAKPDVITSAGKVTRPDKGGFVNVKLTAKAGNLERVFYIDVLAKDVKLDAEYSAAFSEIITLNPLMSTGSSDSDVYSYLVDYLFGSDYDWEDAMKNGYADFPGDFSKIVSDKKGVNDFEEGKVDVYMPAIKMKRTLAMAAKYPYSVNNATDNMIADSYGVLLDQDKAKTTLDNEWIIYLRDDLKFEDGRVINADVFEYSFKQYLNPKLKNARANYLYNTDYIPLVNGKNYYDQVQGISWEDVGFEKIDDLTFKIKLTNRYTQYHVMTYLGIINLVHPEQFEKGFNATGTENFYGSVQLPLISYGQFKLANNYDATNKFVFTRDDNNYAAWEYIAFKTINGPIIKDQDQVINEFEAGNLDIAGVGGEFWNEFKDDDNLYVAPSNSFYRIAISLDRGEDATRPSAPILAYDDFRRALYLATDRQDFADNVQPPSQGALGFLSNIHQVTEWATMAYADSDIFFEQLDDLGLSPDTLGYNLVEAKKLFDAARAEAIEDGKYTANEKIVVQFSYYDAGSNTRIANWVKKQYEKVFNAEGENIFEIELNSLSSAELNQQRDSGDFDLVFTGMSGATFQATFGMGYIFSPTYSTFLVGKGHGIPTKPVKAEILELFDIVSSKDEADRTATEQKLFNALKESNGVFEGTFDQLFDFWNDIDEFAVDYEGQEEDLHHITAALERALLEQMVAVPLFSSTSAAVLADDLVRIPHAYSLFMGWGGMGYMYKKAPATE